MDENTKKDIRWIILGIIILTVIMIIVFAVIGKFDSTVLLGGLLGCAITIVNFLLLIFSVKKSVEKTTNGAKGFMGTSYVIRLLLIAAIVIFAIKSPYLNYIAAIIPLVFPRLVIMILKLRKG